MTIPSKPFDQFTADMVASFGSDLGVVPDLSPGDFLLAEFEAVGGQLVFLQAVIQQVLRLTRAATSVGPDLDSWMAQFNFPRLSATFATGPVILGSLLPASSAVAVPAATLIGGVQTGGTLVQTDGGAIVFVVVADTSQPAYQPQSNTYLMPAGASTVTVTVEALVAGSSSNVSAGQLTQLGSQIGGLSTVINTVPITDGADAESDPDYRARFVLFLATLARATRAAILAAALGTQQGLQIALAENQTPTGAPLLGSFTTFVDDGTGSPPSSLLSSVFAAVDATRAFSVQPFVSVPAITTAAIVLAVRLAPGITLAAVQPLVQAAVAAAGESLVAGQTLFVSAIEQAALSVVGVVAVRPGTTINGQATDLTPATFGEIRIMSTGVQVGTY